MSSTPANSVQIEPTPAAAPSINHTKKAEPPHQGVIKVVIDESDKNRYLKLGGPNTDCRLTDDVGEALRVRCNSLSNATLLERTVSVSRIIMSLYDAKTHSPRESRMAHVIRG